MGLSLTSIEMRLAEKKSLYSGGLGQLRLLEEQRAGKAAALSELGKNVTRWQKTQLLLTKVAAYAKKQLVQRVEAVVTAALRSIMTDRPGIAFKVVFDEIGRKRTADWEVESKYGQDDTISNSPEDDRGGGIADIVSFALRLALIELALPRCEGPVMLDEPGKQISIQYARNLAVFLKSYALKTGRQVWMVTHNLILASAGDLVYWFTQVDGVTGVRRIGADELQDLFDEAEKKARTQTAVARDEEAIP